MAGDAHARSGLQSIRDQKKAQYLDPEAGGGHIREASGGLGQYIDLKDL